MSNTNRDKLNYVISLRVPFLQFVWLVIVVDKKNKVK